MGPKTALLQNGITVTHAQSPGLWPIVGKMWARGQRRQPSAWNRYCYLHRLVILHGRTDTAVRSRTSTIAR
ncbi:MAG: hypothetical protein JWR37_5565 [Mycobacterium sp.]|jgi:hypothetical protein|nr:hypothetical protein [Mycobacterium sp.]